MTRSATSAPCAGARRRTGARTRKQRRAAASPPAVTGVRRGISLYHLLSEEGLDRIDRATDRILQGIGIELRGDGAALALWREAGADVQGERVRFEPGLLKANSSPTSTASSWATST